MHFRSLVLLSFFLIVSGGLAQDWDRLHYMGSDGKRAFFPLGHISFADEVSAVEMGYPKPQLKFRDSSQCLSRPNYRSYNSPDFVSLGCGGSLTVTFTNNGFMNLPGKDLYIFEVGPARERTKVEISTDGRSWLYAGVAVGGTSWLDLEAEGIDRETLFYHLRLTDLKDECDGKSAGADIDAIGAVSSVIAVDIASDVLFDVDRSELKSTALKTIDTLVTVVQQIPRAEIRIEGHTDSDGTALYNMELSQNRCQAVRQMLESELSAYGKYDFKTMAFGESKPRAPNTSAQNKQLNRRVEIYVLPSASAVGGIKK